MPIQLNKEIRNKKAPKSMMGKPFFHRSLSPMEVPMPKIAIKKAPFSTVAAVVKKSVGKVIHHWLTEKSAKAPMNHMFFAAVTRG